MLRLVALLSLALLACAAPAAAQTPIHRCIGANGGAVFTDQPCAALRATPVNPATSTDTPAPSGPPPVLCAASVDELRQSVIDAFARRDSVRMGGLILWDGYGRGAAIADIRALTALMEQPLLQVDLPAPAASTRAPPDDLLRGDAAAPTPSTAPNQLVLHTAGADGAGSTWRFDIVRQAGCLWLRNAQ
ncbi:DUF4124 domain-containing protein [Rhodanobacter lindaniclasticus]|uniref:DUF4124 domain-containing protein n=1 Tax=Rhodanobacter lindaniclasticus TaxID=75310 RepID=A0A4S3KG52_9GAMM|nr:DUF4124 domain-containing protein [Rhodanobacter lindaniclasticus]THD07622.1 DUF4124 domain-containing protein [Rhodanobacter lindaniclasticus]